MIVAKEIAYNIFWDWKAISRTLSPMAVKKRLEKLGFEHDPKLDSFIIKRKMSSDRVRGMVHSIGLNTVAVEGTRHAEEI